MNYKDPITEELKPIYFKTADTLPVGTIAEYDGEGVPDGWEEVDTGWQDATILEGYTGSLKYKKIGSIVQVIGYVAGDFANAQFFAQLPYPPFMQLNECARVVSSNDLKLINVQDETGKIRPLGFDATNETIQFSFIYMCDDTVKHIRKKSTSIGVVAKTVNERSESIENVYSCEFINGEELWTNSEPGVVFETQNITLELNKYKYIEITYAYSMESLQYTKTVKVEIGKNSTLDYVSEGINISCRNIQVTTAGIHFDGNNFNGTINNVYCIPLAIKGYK